MLKKTFAILLSLTLALTLFGCGAIDINISTDTEYSITETDTSPADIPETSGEASTDASVDVSADVSAEASDDISADTSDGTSTPSEEVSEEDENPYAGFDSSDVVVFLGDSIAQGYGLANIENERYSALIEQKYGCKTYNYAVAGDDGADLIALLDSGSCSELKNATVIVLSIGANNVLKAAESLYPIIDDLKGEASVNTTDIDFSTVFKDVSDGADRFKTELPTIIEKLRSVNKDAQIIFQTVYNPYKDFTNISVKLGVLDVTFAAFSASSVKLINNIIVDGADTHGYTLAEVGAYFDQTVTDRLVNAVNDGSNFDPHPNKAGHEAIAQVVNGVVK